MPDDFGGGPTDPEAVWNAIQEGARPGPEHELLLPRGVDDQERARWLAVVDTPTGTAWVLVRTRGVGLDRETFEAIARSRLGEGGRLLVSSQTLALAAPVPGDVKQIAFLAPA